MMCQFVVSDMAGTVLSTDPWDAIRSHPAYDADRGKRELLKILPIYIGSKLKLVPDAYLRDQWLRRMAMAFAGQSRAVIQEIFQHVVDHDIEALYIDPVVERLQQHHSEGAHVILVSGMFTDLLDMLVIKLGIDGAVGTRLAFDADGICTGKVDGQTCVGDQKLTFINTYMRQKGYKQTLSDCCAYADSYSDLPLLMAAGQSVAVFPEPRLEAIARSHNWEILSGR